MKAIKNLYVYGKGPSSSHTIGPQRAAKHFKSLIEGKTFDIVNVTLYGSLALTGKGHHTPDIIQETFKDYFCKVNFDYLSEVDHPNTMVFETILNDEVTFKRTYYSIGGGVITCLEDKSLDDIDIYHFKNFDEIKAYIAKKNYTHLYEICEEIEPDLGEYLSEIFDHMLETVEAGLHKEGQLQAGHTLFVDRTASKIYQEAKNATKVGEQVLTYLAAYAYAVAEENASGSYVVTAPTCGSAGVFPSVVYFLYHNCAFTKERIIKGMMSAGLIGDVFKQNATISGAMGGCQAEIGVAVCMATALLCDINDLSIYQIEYGCELAMEHHLGLTCDPVDGYVVIPCVERNAVGAVRSYEAFLFAKIVSKGRKNSVSLDEIVETMMITGSALSHDYRETSKGGISLIKNKE